MVVYATNILLHNLTYIDSEGWSFSLLLHSKGEVFMYHTLSPVWHVLFCGNDFAYKGCSVNVKDIALAVCDWHDLQATGGVKVQQQNTYGRPSVGPPYQPAPVYSNRGPVAKNEAPARIVPIAALNPYQGRWTIKARVTAKNDVRRFHNARGDGKVFSFDLLDADNGEIRATCFNNVVDQFYDKIDVGMVYFITKGSLKAAKKNFNHLKNDWEIFLESSSTVEPCFEGDGSIPQQQFHFRPIGDVENMENNAMVDVIGTVPIAALNPYQGRWTIKARVTAKSDVRRFHNARGDGKVFSFDLLDADNGEIRATCFNNVVDQFYDKIDVGMVYFITKGSLKAAKKNFNHLKNDWEIFLESSSTVEPCFEGDGSIPQQQFHFRPIGDVENMENNAMVDVIGIVVLINLSSTIMRKNGIETHKRTL
jgi:ssDNA-binding replication factor A large subunit